MMICREYEIINLGRKGRKNFHLGCETKIRTSSMSVWKLLQPALMVLDLGYRVVVLHGVDETKLMAEHINIIDDMMC